MLSRLRKLPKADRIECLLAIAGLPESFGQPHVHSGLGIRKVGKRLFEGRANISLRFVFLDRQDELFIAFLGNHDEVTALLRRGDFG